MFVKLPLLILTLVAVIVQPEDRVTFPTKAPPLPLMSTLPPKVPVQVIIVLSPLPVPSITTVAPVIVRVPPDEVKSLSTVQVPVVAVWVPPETVNEPSLISKVWAFPVQIPSARIKEDEPTVTPAFTVIVPVYPETIFIPATFNALSTVAPLSQSGSKVAISELPGAAPASPLPQPAGLVVFQLEATEVLAASAPTQYKVAAETEPAEKR